MESFCLSRVCFTKHAGERAGYKVRVATAEECLFRGAAGCSAQINLGDEYEPEMIVEMGALTGEAIALGVPVLVCILEEQIIVSDDDKTGELHTLQELVELGAMLSSPMDWNAESLPVCSAVPIPVLIAGGPWNIIHKLSQELSSSD